MKNHTKSKLRVCSSSEVLIEGVYACTAIPLVTVDPIHEGEPFCVAHVTGICTTAFQNIGETEANARRLAALWNRFLYVSNEALGLDQSNEPPHETGWRGVTLGMLTAWLDAGKMLYPNRSCDAVALNRIVSLLGEAEAILAAVPLTIPKSPSPEAKS